MDETVKRTSYFELLLVKLNEELMRHNKVLLSFNNVQLESPFGAFYSPFINRQVENEAPVWVVLPTKIEAEDYIFNNGLARSARILFTVSIVVVLNEGNAK
jgi:hypothetical protein